jgi:hypothetical protein
MAMRKRKTLVVCETCHQDIHAGRVALSTCSVARAVGSRMGMAGTDRSVLGAVCQAAVASPVTLFHVVNRTAISRRYCSAASR